MENKNKLISEFVGRKGKHNSNLYTFPGVPFMTGLGVWYLLSDAKFRSSWDWLMPVIQKCYDDISPMLDGQNGKDENLIGEISGYLLDGMIGECYEAVVRAIEWYNSQKNYGN